jgi:very-short-patch-repair endonuclease
MGLPRNSRPKSGSYTLGKNNGDFDILDVSAAYNDSTFGLKLGEIYRKLGSKKGGIIKLVPYWTKASYATVQEAALQLNSLQAQLGEDLDLPVLRERPSYAHISNETFDAFRELLEELTNGVRYLESVSVALIGTGRHEEVPFHSETTDSLRELVHSVNARAGAARWFSWGYHRDRRRIKRAIREANQYLKHCAKQFNALAVNFLPRRTAEQLASGVLVGNVSSATLRAIARALSHSFNSFKSFDRTCEDLSAEIKDVVEKIRAARNAGLVKKQDVWGDLLETEVLCSHAKLLEEKHPVISTIRSEQIDSLRKRLGALLEQKHQFNIQRIRSNAKRAIETHRRHAFFRELNSDVSKTRNILSIRKLNEKYLGKDFYRSLLPVWLVSPEVVSDIFPLTRGLFDVVIFDEASQCTVEDGLPAVYRGKQVIIAGDEKQLPPNRMFETQAENDELGEDEEATAADEPSLLTLAKRTLRYKSYMLEWHYRSRHEELVTFSNEVFYHGRMKIAPNVIPFRKGNLPAITWHPVTGYWEERQNRAEAERVIELIRYYLSKEDSASVGVITFNLPQKELILDRIDELQSSDPEFAELLSKNKTLPVDKQLFVKNIENVQGDERDVIIFSVAYARSHPGGRVNQLFGSLNSKGGENRLNVAVTRAIKRVDIVASINPETDLNVSTSRSVGPKVLKNYLCFAKMVASGDIDRANTILNELNPNLQRRNAESIITESPFESEVLEALQSAGYTVDTQVGQSGFRIDLAVVHPDDPGRYILGIECDGAMFHSGVSVRERDVFRQRFLEDRGWTIHRIWSTSWWEHKDREILKVRRLIETLLSNQQRQNLRKA